MTRGFSLVEVMLTAAVLGLGAIALAHTHNQAHRGVVASRLQTAALRIAEQRIEHLATIPIDRLAGCAGPVTGCRTDRSTLAPVLGNVGAFRCTQLVDEMDFHDPNVTTQGRFRVDTVVAAHPDPRQQVGALVISVSVCWTDQTGHVQQVMLQRMAIPEV